MLRGMSRGVRNAAAAASCSNVSYSNIGVNNGGWLHYGWYAMLEQDKLDYDFIGYHWYSEMGDFDHAGPLDNNNTDPMYDVFANLLKFNKPIWITELDRRGGSSANPIHGNPLSQPEYLDREIGRLANLSAAHSNVIEAVFIYELYDEPQQWKSPLAFGHGRTCGGDPERDGESCYGLVSMDWPPGPPCDGYASCNFTAGSRKPAWSVVKRWAEALAAKPHQRGWAGIKTDDAVPAAAAAAGGAVFSVAAFGGVPGEGGNNTAAFASTIAACTAHGGGTVLVPAGLWVSGGIRLGSDMTLHLAEGATIRGIAGPTPANIIWDYPLYNGSAPGVVGPQSLVLADGCTNLTIAGTGTIDGNGPPFWGWANLWPGYDFNNASDPPTAMAGRPTVLRAINCTNLIWRDVRVIRSPFWATQIIGSRHVLVERVRIHVNDSNYCPHGTGGHCYQPTNEDGLDLAASQHVVIRDSEIYAHDDSICLLAGSGWWSGEGAPAERQATFDVLVINCTFTSEQGAIAVDVAWGCGGAACHIHDVTVTACRVALPGFGEDGDDNGRALLRPSPVAAGATGFPPPCKLRTMPWDSPYGCVWPMTGQVVHIRGGPTGTGIVEGFLFENIAVGAVMQVLFLAMCLGYDTAHPCPNNTHNLPAGVQLNSFRNLTFRNLRTQYASERFLNFFGVDLPGSQPPITGLVLENVTLGACGPGLPPVQCVDTVLDSAVGVSLAGQPLPNLCANATTHDDVINLVPPLINSHSSSSARGLKTDDTTLAERRQQLGKQPHLFMLIVDDLGFGNVGWNRKVKTPEVHTPTMDQLVADGIQLDRF